MFNLNIHVEENPESDLSMNRYRATFDDNYFTWGFGGTPLAAAINLLGKYRWNEASQEYDIKTV